MREEILKKVREILSDISGADYANASEEMLLHRQEEGKNTAGLSSLDMMEFVVALEMAYDIEIPHEEHVLLYDISSVLDLIIKILEENEKENREIFDIRNSLFD